ncbi:MAG: AMP-binding protein [Bacteroidetes bacterium]|nr:AMP-binding protein [Bacteroidota bacterium]
MDLTSQIPIPGDLDLKADLVTLVTVLQRRSALHPGKKAFAFLANGEDESGFLSYGELDRGARNIAQRLTSMGLKGQNVLMFYPPGLDFIFAFFGCLYSGTIPATAYPPRKNRSLHRIRTITEDCRAKSILTTEAIARSLERNFAEDPMLSGMTWHTTDTWQITDEAASVSYDPGFEDLAFLQYTSGSTGDPKGVMVSHRNIMYNLRSLQLIFQITPDDVAVHWVPQFHDLGLIFGILETVFSGSFAVLIPPFIFISNPIYLMQAITRYRATIGGQPDFAFNHCVEKIKDTEMAGLDLSSLRVMYSGAEPVRKSTFDLFLSRFSPFGLHPEALIPAYGMAESTLILTGAKTTGPTVYLAVSASALEKDLVVPLDPLNKDFQDDIQWIASNGKPGMDTSILIVHHETHEILPPYKVGEIWASGSTVTMGYYGKPRLSADIFNATPAGLDNPVWLRTGDLGFLYNDELFITGRQKDLIIIHGRNYYPQDIECVVESSHSSLRKTCCAALSIEHDGQERLSIVAELKRSLIHPDNNVIFEAITASVSQEFEIRPVRITLIRTGSLIKTSSGKIMRRANRESLLGGNYDLIDDRWYDNQEINLNDIEGGQGSNLEQFLVAWASSRLNNGRPVNPANSLTAYGIDSLRAVELTEETKKIFGFEWQPSLFFEEIPISQLALEGLTLMEEQ